MVRYSNMENLNKKWKTGYSQTYIFNRRLIGITLIIFVGLVCLGGIKKHSEHQFAEDWFNSVKGWNVYESTPSASLKPKVSNVRFFNTKIGVDPKVVNMPEAFQNLKHPEIDWKIYTLESSQGRNDSCKDQGKINGFGFGQNTFSWQCFNSLQEVAGYVDEWVDLQLLYKDLPQALCYYNRGIVEENCQYYQNYLSLN